MLVFGAIFYGFDTKAQKNGIEIGVFSTSRPIWPERNKYDRQRKKLIQAQHRLEEAQARDRVKQRKARTRRLIQEGAILEKALPQTVSMDVDELETYLHELTN